MIMSGISPDVQNLVEIRLQEASRQIGEIRLSAFLCLSFPFFLAVFYRKNDYIDSNAR